MYVGKAKNLKKRLAQYVQGEKKSDGPWRRSFLLHIADFDVTVTQTELEALLLETNLIKQLKPKYNVLMKDDKNYLFVRVSVQDAYPRVETVRRIVEDGAKYFGPYMNSHECHETLEMLQEVLQYRACRESIDALNRHTGTRDRPCLEYQIGKCCGLCAALISHEEYRSRIGNVMDYLKGKKDTVKSRVQERMIAAAKERKFEQAARLRNYLLLLEGKKEAQVATDATGEDSDVVGVAILSERAHVVLLHRRGGRLIGEAHFALLGSAADVPSVLEQFLPQFYEEGREVPPMIFLPEALDDDGSMQDLLCERRGKPVKLIVPERGRKSHLVQLAERNAHEKARQQELKWEAEERNTTGALEELKTLLSLPKSPKRIECYDISHLGGTETVGSMVVTIDGKAKSDHYRSFTIRTLKRGVIDDYRSLQEVLQRRLKHLTVAIQREEERWEAAGMVIGKGKKSDAPSLQTIDQQSQESAVKPSEYLVARHADEIVGLARLVTHEGHVIELASAWAREPYLAQGLAEFLARKLLRTVKKGKVYAVVPANRELGFALLGFRVIEHPPATITQSIERRGASFDEVAVLPMMWEASQNKIDASLSSTPDLIVIDGGKGQLSAVMEVVTATQLSIPVIGLAKREEEIFIPGATDPLPVPTESPAKFLLMRLRDEAHRFSNRHRERRVSSAMTASVLEQVPGIGEETMKELYRTFGSLANMAHATDDELKTVLSESQLSALRAHDTD